MRRPGGDCLRFGRCIRLCSLVIALATLAFPQLASSTEKTISLDQLPRLHAALVLKMAPFVQWPDNSPELGSGEISLGVAGNEDVFLAFDELSDKKIKGEKQNLIRLQLEDVMPPCRILFISQDHFEKILAVWQEGEPPFGVLTVGDAPDFNARGGIIQLYLENGQPRFSVNLDAAQRAGIGFSSRFLKVAAIYQEEKL